MKLTMMSPQDSGTVVITDENMNCTPLLPSNCTLNQQLPTSLQYNTLPLTVRNTISVTVRQYCSGLLPLASIKITSGKTKIVV